MTTAHQAVSEGGRELLPGRGLALQRRTGRGKTRRKEPEAPLPEAALRPQPSAQSHKQLEFPRGPRGASQRVPGENPELTGARAGLGGQREDRRATGILQDHRALRGAQDGPALHCPPSVSPAPDPGPHPCLRPGGAQVLTHRWRFPRHHLSTSTVCHSPSGMCPFPSAQHTSRTPPESCGARPR